MGRSKARGAPFVRASGCCTVSWSLLVGYWPSAAISSCEYGRSALSTSMNLSPPSVPGSRTPSGMRPPLSPARTSLTKKRRLDPRLVGGVSLDIQGFVAWLFLFLLSDNHLLVSVECSTFHSFHGCGIPHPREEQKALLSTGSTRRQ